MGCVIVKLKDLYNNESGYAVLDTTTGTVAGTFYSKKSLEQTLLKLGRFNYYNDFLNQMEAEELEDFWSEQ